MMAAVQRIRPFPGPIDLTIRPPGSKSETVRALAAAALADGRSHLYAPLVADDPLAMAGAIRQFGIDVGTNGEPWTVDGRGGHLDEPEGQIDANESGLSARILLAMAGSRDGSTTLVGRGRLPQRPMGGVVDVLRAQGVEVSGDRLPIEVTGRGRLWGGAITVDCSSSSQFATAVMIVSPLMHEPAVIQLNGLVGSSGYLDVTASVMRKFGAGVMRTVTGYEIGNDGYTAADVVIEPDASAAVYPMALAAITGGVVVIDGLDQQSAQPDMIVAAALENMGCRVTWGERRVTIDASDATLSGIDVDMSEAPDGALALAVVCLFADTASQIHGLGSLRHKESDRLSALRHEMTKLGGDVTVDGDSLTLRPTPLQGAVIDPHGDHRIAMALALVGARVGGVGVESPSVVEKTWPGFWQFLEEAPG